MSAAPHPAFGHLLPAAGGEKGDDGWIRFELYQGSGCPGHEFGTSTVVMSASRRRAVGAEIVNGGVSFRVWAPAHARVEVVLSSGARYDLGAERDGYFSATIGAAQPGTRYRFALDGGEELYPDPASRFQPEGPHGPSEVIDPGTYEWRDRGWPGIHRKGAVVYEMHIGTFTPGGTFASAIGELKALADLGINVLEVMPVNEFPGRFGWGYDGVDLWAPTRLYGHPDDFRRFVDTAHQLGLGVILDVVYNHFGPDGCFMTKFTPDYFTTKYKNEWGDAINFDGPNSTGVREFFIENAACWIDEFHLDGLRLDATQSINDDSEPNVIQEIAAAARKAAGTRSIFVVAENEPQDVKLLDRYGLDGMWNDDWHHSATVAATGNHEAYYSDYRGKPQEFVSMAKLGFLYQGQWYEWQKKHRGTPSGHIAPERFVCCLQNHDQIANSAHGTRIHQLTSPAACRALTALMFLQPQTPMLFQGQEFASSKPFLYFADHNPELAKLVRKGRHEFLRQFPSIAAEEVASGLAPPEAVETYEQCKLDFSERETNAPALALHRDLIRLRRSDPTLALQSKDGLDGAVLSSTSFLLRWLTGGPGDRLLLVNLGTGCDLSPAAEPLLAAPAGLQWEVLWSSESVAYGGSGTPEIVHEGRWRIPAKATVLLQPKRFEPA